MIIINYLILGLLVNFIFEIIPKKEDRLEFTLGERIYLILTWPISLTVFIYEFIRIMIYGKDDE